MEKSHQVAVILCRENFVECLCEEFSVSSFSKQCFLVHVKNILEQFKCALVEIQHSVFICKIAEEKNEDQLNLIR